ncbi:MAG: hypothetical protein V4592_07660 [Bacteroidota bacterium]
MEPKQNTERFLEVLDEINQTEEAIVNSPQYELINNFTQRLNVDGQRAKVFIEASKGKYSKEDLLKFIDIYCFGLDYNINDPLTENRSFIIEFILVGNNEEAFPYTDNLVFYSKSKKSHSALILLLRLAGAAGDGIRKDETFLLILKHLDSFDNDLLNTLLRLLPGSFSDHPTAIKIIRKINKLQDKRNGNLSVFDKLTGWFKK